jgi:hypothetical protein
MGGHLLPDGNLGNEYDLSRLKSSDAKAVTFGTPSSSVTYCGIRSFPRSDSLAG